MAFLSGRLVMVIPSPSDPLLFFFPAEEEDPAFFSSFCLFVAVPLDQAGSWSSFLSRIIKMKAAKGGVSFLFGSDLLRDACRYSRRDGDEMNFPPPFFFFLRRYKRNMDRPALYLSFCDNFLPYAVRRHKCRQRLTLLSSLPSQCE